MEIRVLPPMGEEGRARPPTCPRLRLAPARHSWTITYRFPTSAANTWERIPRPAPLRASVEPTELLDSRSPAFQSAYWRRGESGAGTEEKFPSLIGQAGCHSQPGLSAVAAKGLCSAYGQNLLLRDQGPLRGGKLF